MCFALLKKQKFKKKKLINNHKKNGENGET